MLFSWASEDDSLTQNDLKWAVLTFYVEDLQMGGQQDNVSNKNWLYFATTHIVSFDIM